MTRTANRFSDTEPLSQQSIVRAAIGIADREGLRNLTMRRLGRALGVEAMSIYHHVPNKDALLGLVLSAIAGEIARDAARPAAAAPDAPSAVEAVRTYCLVLRQALARHPNVRPLLTTESAHHLTTTEPARQVTATLVECGFDDEAAAWILGAAHAFVIGHECVISAAPDADASTTFDLGLSLMLEGLRVEAGE